MELTRSLLGRQTIVGEPERRGDERSEAARSGVSPTIERETSTTPPDPEVTARHARRRFTTQYKLEILRKADACVRPGQLGALLRKEGLYSSHLVTWRRQRADGLTPKKRGRKSTRVDPYVKRLEHENRRLTTRLQKAEALLAYQKKVAELLQIPLKPFVSDEDD
jgi:transposase-like protein